MDDEDLNKKRIDWIYANVQAIGRSQSRFLYLLFSLTAFSILLFLSKSPVPSLLGIQIPRDSLLTVMPTTIIITSLGLLGSLIAAGLSRTRLTKALKGEFDPIGDKIPFAEIDLYPNLLDYLVGLVQTKINKRSPEPINRPEKFRISEFFAALFFYPLVYFAPTGWAAYLAFDIAIQRPYLWSIWRLLDFWHLVLLAFWCSRAFPSIRRQCLRAFPNSSTGRLSEDSRRKRMKWLKGLNTLFTAIAALAALAAVVFAYVAFGVATRQLEIGGRWLQVELLNYNFETRKDSGDGWGTWRIRIRNMLQYEVRPSIAYDVGADFGTSGTTTALEWAIGERGVVLALKSLGDIKTVYETPVNLQVAPVWQWVHCGRPEGVEVKPSGQPKAAEKPFKENPLTFTVYLYWKDKGGAYFSSETVFRSRCVPVKQGLVPYDVLMIWPRTGQTPAEIAQIEAASELKHLRRYIDEAGVGILEFIKKRR